MDDQAFLNLIGLGILATLNMWWFIAGTSYFVKALKLNDSTSKMLRDHMDNYLDHMDELEEKRQELKMREEALEKRTSYDE